MLQRILSLMTVFAVAFFILGASPVTVDAQSIGIKISPVKIEELVDPGQVITRQVKVTNVSNDPKIFYVYLRDFRAEGETGKAKLIAPGSEEGYYIASWIDITNEGIPFAPNEEKTISFSIAVPEQAGPGGYYGAILYGTEPPKLQLESEEKGAGMAVAQQTACLVLLQVKGEADEEAQVREFNTDKDLYSTPFDVDFLVRIENSGNVHVKPYGAISITNMFGKEVSVIRVNEAGGNVLPNSIRRFEDLNWSGDNAFGRYTATLGLSYGTAADQGGQGKSTLFAVKTFWIVPWRIVAPVAAGLILAGGLMFLFLRLYRNKAIRRAMEQAGLGHVRYVKKFEGPSPALHLSMIMVAVFVVLFLVVTGTFFLFFA